MIYAYELFKGGYPQRTEYPRQVLLECGDWGRVIYNGRHVSLAHMSDWWYRQDVLKIAFLEKPILDPFKGKPKRIFSDLAHLI